MKIDMDAQRRFYKRYLEKLHQGDTVGRVEGGILVDETAETINLVKRLLVETRVRPSHSCADEDVSPLRSANR
jgi:hypothetical protein